MAKLNPGETYVCNSRASYAMLLEEPDPSNPRILDVMHAGRRCLEYRVFNGDMGKSHAPRSQAQSSTFMKRGGHYIVDHYYYLKRSTFPIWQKKGWFNFWEKYGLPHAGPPPLSWGSHDGVNLDFTRGEPPWDVLYKVPMFFDSWECVSFDFVNDDVGALNVALNGVPVYTAPSFPVINNSDKDGNWMTVSHLYMERDAVVPDGVQVGPVWMYDVVRQIS